MNEKKTLKVIEEEEFRSDLTDYAFSFSRRIMVDVHNSNLKNKLPIIKEEYSKSKSNNSESENKNENSSSYQSSSSLYKIKNHKQFK